MVTNDVSNCHLYTYVLRVIISWKVRPKIIEAVKNTERERERERKRAWREIEVDAVLEES